MCSPLSLVDLSHHIPYNALKEEIEMKRSLALALSFLLIISAVAVAAAQAEENHYNLQVKLDPRNHTISGSELVEYYNDSETALNSLYFLLLPNLGRERNPYLDSFYIDQQYWNGFDPSWLKVGAVTDDQGQALEYELQALPPALQTYSLKGTLLLVHLPGPLAPGGSFKLKLEFTTKFPQMITGDQCYHRDIYTWRLGWNPIAVPASLLHDGRLATDDHFRFELPAAWYEATFSIPKDYILASGADEQKELTGVAGTEAAPPTEAQTASEQVHPANVGPAVAKAVSQKIERLPLKESYKKISLQTATPVRSLAFAAGPAETFKKYTLTHNGLEIEVYYLPGREGAARELATYAAEILDHYQKLYGAYSHKRIALIDSTASGLWGMAADGFVLLGDGAFADKDLGVPGLSDRLVEWLLAHELGHQWFGIGAGADFNAENWISEGFAQYLSITYFEGKYGSFGPNVFVFERPGLLEKLVEHELGFYNLRQHNVELPYLQVLKDRFDEAVIKPEKDVKYGNWSAIRIYDKGYLVLRALAGEIGPARMTVLIKQIYQKYDHKILTVKELEQAAEEVSGKNLGEFFKDWLYTAARVDYGVKRVTVAKQDSGKFLNRIYLFRHGEAVLPVELKAVTEAGKDIEQTWDGREKEHVLELKTASPIKEVELDPEEMIPDADRLNNFYPIKLRVITTGKNDLPLDAYLLRFDPTTQTLEGGTLWQRWLLGQGVGAFAIYLGRGSTFRGYLDLSGLDLYGTVAGELELNLTGYSNPPVGSPARYWEPTDQVSLVSGRTIDRTVGKGVNYLEASWTRSEMVRDHYSTEFSLLGYPFKFGRLSLRSQRRFRPIPHLYLDEEVRLGLGASLPRPFQFTLDELHSFYRKTEKGKWEKEHFPGNIKLSGQFSLSFPAKREMDYDLANLAVLDEVREALFLTWGQTWEGLEDIDFTSLKLEVGLEATTSGRTLGGLFPFSITVGFAYPLLGIEPEGQRGWGYIRVQLPLL